LDSAAGRAECVWWGSCKDTESIRAGLGQFNPSTWMADASRFGHEFFSRVFAECCPPGQTRRSGEQMPVYPPKDAGLVESQCWPFHRPFCASLLTVSMARIHFYASANRFLEDFSGRRNDPTGRSAGTSIGSTPWPLHVLLPLHLQSTGDGRGCTLGNVLRFNFLTIGGKGSARLHGILAFAAYPTRTAD
jgi:hypothetical protein